jgi:hypothetical protein
VRVGQSFSRDERVLKFGFKISFVIGHYSFVIQNGIYLALHFRADYNFRSFIE